MNRLTESKEDLVNELMRYLTKDGWKRHHVESMVNDAVIPFLDAQISKLAGTPDEELEIIFYRTLHEVLDSSYTNAQLIGLSRKMLANIQPIYEARIERERERIIELLDLHENELGFCEISNHIPYAEIERFKK